MTLVVPLSPDQVAAACRLHARLESWRDTDSALIRLKEQMPGFKLEACILKSVAINTLYGTQVLAIVRMARHVCDVLRKTEIASAGPDLVKKIGELPNEEGAIKRAFVSFAAKFCHCFVNEERFPIYDDAAKRMLAHHLGKNEVKNAKHPYAAFCESMKCLSTEAGLSCSGRELDRYLWIAGMYERWLRQRHQKSPQVNAELRRLFNNPSKDAAADLDALLPTTFFRAFT